MITCPNCNAQLPDTAKFCTGCGATLADFETTKPVVEKVTTVVDQSLPQDSKPEAPAAATSEAPTPEAPSAPAPKSYEMPQTHADFEPEKHNVLTNMSEPAPQQATSTEQPMPAPTQGQMPASAPTAQPQQLPPQQTAPITGPDAAVAAGAAPVAGTQTAFQAATGKKAGKGEHIPTAFEQATGSNGGSRVDRDHPPIFPANQPRYGSGPVNK